MSAEFEEERLDSPLVVHKITDASYHETTNMADADQTHGEDGATLERHRFRRVKKKKKWPYFLMFTVVIVAVVCALYYSGVISPQEPDTTEPPTTEPPSTTSVAERFKNVITVKGTYVFFEGEEVDGLNGLEREIKYLDTSIQFTIQDESADQLFLSEEVIPLLESYGFKYETKFIISSGLKSQYE